MKEFEYSEAEASKAETAILVGLVTPTQDEAKRRQNISTSWNFSPIPPAPLS